MTIFKKAKFVRGNNLTFRNAEPADAAFILSLRTNKEKNAYISPVSDNIDVQNMWLQKYASETDQVYFIITANQKSCGTVRLYDAKGTSFCWGSWLLAPGSPPSYAIESALMVYSYALKLGFKNSHFDVRHGNKSVWKFHERFGAIRTNENEIDIFYHIDQKAIELALVKYEKFLSRGICILDD